MTSIHVAGFALLPVAYIGPGAGFAVTSSFVILIVAVLAALVSFLFLPFRLFRRMAASHRRKLKGSGPRVIVLGLDGLDPRRTRLLMDQGKLPHMARLRARGSFSEMDTTTPAISPVAWSSFMTGVNPGKHNIFDFLTRNPHSYVPELSSVRMERLSRRWPLASPEVEIIPLRKSKPFWHILGEHGVFSTILRVPMTFPPEEFNGVCLSGMCVPDIRGTQGTFTLYTTAQNRSLETESGLVITVKPDGNRITTQLPGPTLRGRELQASLIVDIEHGTDSAVVRIDGRAIRLKKAEYSDWVRVVFRAGLRRVSGLCRFLLLSVSPEFELYVTPLHIDPEKPVMPISSPPLYSVYLKKLHGPFATLGFSEDTQALNEQVIDEEAFLAQAYDIHREREKMFLDALEVNRGGFSACVFDLPDRIQHMFFRQQEGTNPHSQEIDRAYCAMDDLVGRVLDMTDDRTALFLISDHGFTSFRWGVNLNAWLREQGLLTLKTGTAGRDFPRDVDWGRTRAYSFGLTGGIYFNLKGRESQGVIERNEMERLKKAIAGNLQGLNNPATGSGVVRRVYNAADLYKGPYADNAPDLVVGFDRGYRVSWQSALGRMEEAILSENTRPWSGDHAVDSCLVPGTFLSNHPVDLSQRPHIMDLAPTILDLYGIGVPSYMDGRKLTAG